MKDIIKENIENQVNVERDSINEIRSQVEIQLENLNNLRRELDEEEENVQLLNKVIEEYGRIKDGFQRVCGFILKTREELDEFLTNLESLKENKNETVHSKINP